MLDPEGELQFRAGIVFDELENNGEASIVGRQVGSLYELIEVAQAFRDPRYETFRVVFVNHMDRVVYHGAITMRHPRLVPIPDDLDAQIRKVIESVDATASDPRDRVQGFYFLHNHPSGDPTPSRPDIALTEKFRQIFDTTFLGHVIVDHDKASFVDGAYLSSAWQTIGYDNDSFWKPESQDVPTDWFQEEVLEPKRVAQLGLALQLEDRPVLVMTTARGNVTSMLDVSPKYIRDIARLKGDAQKARLQKLERVRRMTGSGGFAMLLWNEGEPLDPKDAKRLIELGVVTDVWTGGDKTFREVHGTLRFRDILDEYAIEEGKDAKLEERKSYRNK